MLLCFFALLLSWLIVLFLIFYSCIVLCGCRFFLLVISSGTSSSIIILFRLGWRFFYFVHFLKCRLAGFILQFFVKCLSAHSFFSAASPGTSSLISALVFSFSYLWLFAVIVFLLRLFSVIRGYYSF